MNTPIKDFLDKYNDESFTRLHMPGHKGAFFADDITEIRGADSLYEADGIIRESERNASEIFGTRDTFYGTEGSSQMIKAMCFLACEYAKAKKKDCTPIILASRNAHKSFIHAAMLLQFEIVWIPSEDEYSLCSCYVSPEGLRDRISRVSKKLLMDSTRRQGFNKYLAAVYVTSPDYLGNQLNIEALSKVAHETGLLFLVDNAHGSYLKFMEEDKHPISLGADICADSAHKTLPVLTGGAYLHISKDAPEGIEKNARTALLLFGSTSPSYLTLKSLDQANVLVKRDEYKYTEDTIRDFKFRAGQKGYSFTGEEPLKLTFDMRRENVNGYRFAELLREYKIECDFADPDFVVTMWTPWNRAIEYDKLLDALESIREQIGDGKPKSPYDEFHPHGAGRQIWARLPEVRYQPWKMLYRPKKRVSVDYDICGSVAADALVGCPPAVSPIVAGEVVDKNIVSILQYYGITEIDIVD